MVTFLTSVFIGQQSKAEILKSKIISKRVVMLLHQERWQGLNKPNLLPWQGFTSIASSG